MSMNKGLLFIIFVGCSFIFIIYASFSRNTTLQLNPVDSQPQRKLEPLAVYHQKTNSSEYNIFIIYTKEDDSLKEKLNLFLKSLLKFSSVPLHLHFFCDSNSETSIEEVLKKHTKHRNDVKFTLYDLKDTALKLNDYIFNVMPLFSYSSGSYYNDALFLLSLGLHRVIDTKISRGVLMDVDVVLRTDIKELFQQFNNFSPDTLFGLAPELTPVYRHILYRYRSKNPKTLFGSPYYIKKSKGKKKHHQTEYSAVRHGYPGLNSGVMLLNFDRIRKSRLYEESLSKESIKRYIEKYSFRGHLGDQDFYSILGYELPDLIYHLDCIWNRQLCTWWKENGYSEVFENYFHCEGGDIKIYHGNCNTRIPQ